MQDDPALPLADSGKAVTAPLPGGSVTQRPGRFARLTRWRALPIAVLVFTSATVGIYFIVEPAPKPTVIPKPSPRTVAALGRLIPEGDVVTLAPPFGAADARVAKLLVGVGDVVREGQLVVELDSLPQYRAALSVAQANLTAKQAALVQVGGIVAAARAEAQANRDRAASVASLAEEEAARERDLFARSVTTKVALDRAEAMAVQAARELDRAQAQLSRQAGGKSQPDVALAARELDVARAEVARAEADLRKGQVLAPLAGRVLTLHVRVGEKPEAVGIATMGATDRMEAELEVYQTDIARVARGQPVRLTSAALREPLIGKVTNVGLEVERQTILAADPAANTDARIVRVIVALDTTSARRAAALTGLEVTGTIETDPLETGKAP